MADINTPESLDDILKGVNLPGTAVDSGAEGTDMFGSVNPAPQGGRSEDDSKAYDVKLLRSTISSRAIRKDSPSYNIRGLMSENARICGYTTGTGPKFDFAKAKTTNESGVEVYNLFVKMTPPSKVDGIIVRYPSRAWQELIKSDPDKMDVNAAQDMAQFTVKIIPANEFINWMQSFTFGFLKEADEIFEPYIRKAGKAIVKVMTPSEVAANKKSATVPNVPAVYTAIGGSLKAGAKAVPKLRMKSNYRTKFVTPHNYIAKRVFATMPVQTAYAPEEIPELLEMYFSRYNTRTTKQNQTIPSVFSKLSVEGSKMFHAIQDADGKYLLQSTEYFTSDANASAWNKITVDHWYEKTDTGSPVQIPGTEVKLAKRVKLAEDKPIAFVKETIQDPDKAPAGAYILDRNGAHKNIFAACQGQFNFNVLEQFYTEQANSGRKSSGTGLGSGMEIMGITDQVLEDLFKQAMRG